MRRSTMGTSLMQRSAGGCFDALEYVKQYQKKSGGAAILGVGAGLLGGATDDLGLTLLAPGIERRGRVADVGFHRALGSAHRSAPVGGYIHRRASFCQRALDSIS
jgi:hypothetical protein